MNEQLYLKRVKTHDSNITEKPVAQECSAILDVSNLVTSNI
jgi:hypothetical protein